METFRKKKYSADEIEQIEYESIIYTFIKQFVHPYTLLTLKIINTKTFSCTQGGKRY